MKTNVLVKRLYNVRILKKKPKSFHGTQFNNHLVCKRILDCLDKLVNIQLQNTAKIQF